MPTYVNGVGTGINGGSINAALPGSLVTGNLLIAIGSAFSAGRTLNFPVGWTAIRSSESTGSITSYYRIIDGSEGATITVTMTGGNTAFGIHISQWSDFDPVTPIGNSVAPATATSITATATSVNTTVANSTIVQYVGTSGNRTWSAASGQTQRFDAFEGTWSGATLGIFSQDIASAGATGTKSLTASSSVAWGTTMFVINAPSAVIESGAADFVAESNFTVLGGLERLGAASLVAESDFVVASIRDLVGSTNAWEAVTTFTPIGHISSSGVFSWGKVEIPGSLFVPDLFGGLSRQVFEDVIFASRLHPTTVLQATKSRNNTPPITVTKQESGPVLQATKVQGPPKIAATKQTSPLNITITKVHPGPRINANKAAGTL